jgi:hypothetical protein
MPRGGGGGGRLRDAAELRLPVGDAVVDDGDSSIEPPLLPGGVGTPPSSSPSSWSSPAPIAPPAAPPNMACDCCGVLAKPPLTLPPVLTEAEWTRRPVVAERVIPGWAWRGGMGGGPRPPGRMALPPVGRGAPFTGVGGRLGRPRPPMRPKGAALGGTGGGGVAYGKKKKKHILF